MSPIDSPTPQYRPAYHFTPAANWMNDPNGMVYHQGVWHLFFQYHPHGTTWGPMHWGHASSTDLLHWQEHDIALAPDALGTIFSGSAVVDTRNTAGFGTPDCPTPMVAIFTQHDAAASEAGVIEHQLQSLAFSLDGGATWTFHAGNPVLKNPGEKDFRDPKVIWLDGRQCWLMSLAVGDHIAFYSSPNLKDWTHESDFGAGHGAHDGIWECPDLFAMPFEGRTRWVLLVSLVKGGPNGGSATQYFIGDFDGTTFTAEPGPTRWIDHGPDNYAGVTWAHAPEGRRVLISWMSNWDYAKRVPTSPWRSAMTLPRDLELRRVGTEVFLASLPAREVLALEATPLMRRVGPVDSLLDLSSVPRVTAGRFVLHLGTAAAQSFQLRLGNKAGDQLVMGYDRSANAYFIDRREAGLTDFSPCFAGRHTAPRVAASPGLDLTLYVDACSVELFADAGLTVMSSLCFAREPWSILQLASDDGLVLASLRLSQVMKERA